MRRIAATLLLATTAIGVGCSELDRPAPTAPSFSTGNPLNTGSKEAYTLAVIGDMPYGPQKRDSFPMFIDLINADPKVDLVMHLGDIKAGSSSPCTDEYFADIRSQFDRLKDPLVYTPGDNEWTDCHVASKNNGLFTPTERLQAVRALFFPVPGQTLGGRKKQVLTQADDPANAQYVENTIWMEAQTVFAMLNIQGSNNDKASWGTPLPANAGDYPSQAQERATRAQANRAWLERTFQVARENNAVAVVIGMQADMWDVTSALDGFDDLVVQIGTLAQQFGKPVLILQGDSHAFRVDTPFTPGSPLFGVHPGTPVAPNITRLVVNGSAARTEYVRLTVDPTRKAQLFSWERVPLAP